MTDDRHEGQDTGTDTGAAGNEPDAGDMEYDEAHQGDDGGAGVPGGQYGPPDDDR